MNTKLTLSLDSAIIEKAKKKLQTKEKSLSKLIEDYFKLLITNKTGQDTDSPLVKELTGIASVDSNIDEKDLISEYLLEKYK